MAPLKIELVIVSKVNGQTLVKTLVTSEVRDEIKAAWDRYSDRIKFKDIDMDEFLVDLRDVGIVSFISP